MRHYNQVHREKLLSYMELFSQLCITLFLLAAVMFIAPEGSVQSQFEDVIVALLVMLLIAIHLFFAWAVYNTERFQQMFGESKVARRRVVF